MSTFLSIADRAAWFCAGVGSMIVLDIIAVVALVVYMAAKDSQL